MEFLLSLPFLQDPASCPLLRQGNLFHVLPSSHLNFGPQFSLFSSDLCTKIPYRFLLSFHTSRKQEPLPCSWFGHANNIFWGGNITELLNFFFFHFLFTSSLLDYILVYSPEYTFHCTGRSNCVPCNVSYLADISWGRAAGPSSNHTAEGPPTICYQQLFIKCLRNLPILRKLENFI
jgi:hypothetical protein